MTSSSGTEDSTTDEEVSGKSPTVKLSNRNVRTASSESGKKFMSKLLKL